MEKKSWNRKLHSAKTWKKDEFYTQLSDIERELSFYKEHFQWKTIFCNCDDPEESNFFRYFSLNFEHLWIKKLIATHFEERKKSYKLEITSWLDLNHDWRIDFRDVIKTPLKQNWDFRSSECIDLLKQSDIVVTNPPFSLFREYVAQLVEYEKKFIIIWSLNSITYKEIFKLIKENQLWLGHGFKWWNAYFSTPHEKNFASGVYDENTKLVKFRNVTWYTNLDNTKRHEDIFLFKPYSVNDFKKYDNYDAINIEKLKDIPVDYPWVMWVPITFLDKYNPEQFEIIKFRKWDDEKDLRINGKCPYFRILVKNKKL